MNIPKNKLDDLTKIDGIALARQELLRSRLGIRTYKDLGDLDAQNIVSRLKAERQIVSLEIVAAWCEKARNLAANDPPADPFDWNPFTTFAVEFLVRQVEGDAEEYCTTVHNMETEIGQKWPGIETGEVCLWMRDWVDKAMPKSATPAASASAHEEVPAAPEVIEVPATSEVPAAPKAQAAVVVTPQVAPLIKIQQISLYQDPQAMNASAWWAAGGSFCGMLEGQQPFEAQVSLLINSCDLNQLEQSGVQCELQLFSQQVPGGRILPLGNAVQFPLQGGQHEYVQNIGGLSLPAGTHHLKMAAKIRLTRPVLSYQEAAYLMVG